MASVADRLRRSIGIAPLHAWRDATAHNAGAAGAARVEELVLTKVTVREGETVDRAIKRFKRKVEQAGILKEVRKREHYLKPSVKAKLKARAAEARARKREKRLLLNGV